MKAGLIFLLLVVGVVIFLALYSNPTKIALQDGTLTIYNKKCRLQLPVKVLKKERDSVDMVTIERTLLEIEGVRLFLEQDDLPAKYAFDKPYGDIVEKIFNSRFKEIFSGDGVVVFRGTFDVALFFKTRHNLVLLYPLNPKASSAIISCAKGQKRDFKLRQMPLEKTIWKPEFFILDGFINKDI